MPKFLRDGTGYYSTPSSDQSTVRSGGRAPFAKNLTGHDRVSPQFVTRGSFHCL
jgi:hypothetical protein